MFVHKSLQFYSVVVLTKLLFGRPIAWASDTGVVQIPGDSMMSCVANSLVTSRDISRVSWCPDPGACYTYTEDNRPEGVGCTCFEQLDRTRPGELMVKTSLRYKTGGCSRGPGRTNHKSTTSETETSTSPQISTTQGEPTWQIVFKAVAGSGQPVYESYLYGGDINGNVPEAKEVTSGLAFRDVDIIDTWSDQPISKVKLEVFKAGEVVSWFEFNGNGTGVEGWFDRNLLMDSPYPHIGSLPTSVMGAHFSAKGDPNEKRRFFINHSYVLCEEDCGYLVVIDTLGGTCPWQITQAWPYFMYGTRTDSCSKYETEAGIGDRFVISVKMD